MMASYTVIGEVSDADGHVYKFYVSAYNTEVLGDDVRAAVKALVSE